MRPLLHRRLRPDPTRELVRRARGGDRDAFAILARAELPRVYRTLFRLTGNHEDAEDLAQECMVRAWRSLAWFGGEERLQAWLTRIAVHLARDHFRARSVRRTAALDADPRAPGARDPEDVASGRELSIGVSRAIDRLPVRLRETFVLRVLADRSYEEVGRAVGVTPATARTRVMKARRLLARWMAPWLGGGR